MKTAESQTCVRGGAQILTTAESPEEEREVERAGEGGRSTFGYGRNFCLLFESKALGLFSSSLFSSVSVLHPKYPVVIPLQSFLMTSVYNRVVFCGWLMYRWHNLPQI